MDKIRIIDKPVSEEMLRAELEAVLGGWTCGSYSSSTGSCFEWADKATCGNNQSNYCLRFA